MTDHTLGPLPEAGMTEANPYLDLGPMDPHQGAQILTWYSADQVRAYALAEVARAVEAERERWTEAVMAELDGNGQAHSIVAYATRAQR